ncbi:Laccase-4, partial [Nymphaea thermarum]
GFAQVAPTNISRLCENKEILTVNGQLPGPTLYANKGDRLIVNVINPAPFPITIHWHGLLNPRNPWSDGREYITMCGIPSGSNFTHDLFLNTEEGTIWYHAHSDWTRHTVHGAVVVYPKPGFTYPFPVPYKEYVIVIGELT